MDKRSGKWVRVSLHDAPARSANPDVDILVLDTLLDQLAAFDARKSRVVELLYFGGLTLEETSRVMDVSHATVEREWRAARAWLHAQLTHGS